MNKQELKESAFELLPCPFCGCAIISGSEVYDWPNDDYYICTGCPARTWKKDWNTRAGLAPNAKLIEDAIADLEHSLKQKADVNQDAGFYLIQSVCDRLRKAIEPEGEKV